MKTINDTTRWDSGKMAVIKLKTKNSVSFIDFQYIFPRRTFQSILSHLALSSVIKTCTLYWNRSTFLCVPEIQWVISFIVYAFYRHFFNQVYT